MDIGRREFPSALPPFPGTQRSAYRARNMAEKRAAFILRRRRALGFSKCRWLRTSFKVPSRSIFFLRRRRALSTGSPFFNLISVNNPLFSLAINGKPSWLAANDKHNDA